jgi:hypothetical protein
MIKPQIKKELTEEIIKWDIEDQSFIVKDF